MHPIPGIDEQIDVAAEMFRHLLAHVTVIG
jgi:hypothetical protein